MYSAYLNSVCILDVKNEILLEETVLELEDNSAGSFSFVIYPNNPGYSLASNLLTGIVTVKWDDEVLYKGRILSCEKTWDKALRVETEGELAYLDDTIQRPAEYHELTVLAYVTKLVELHNAQVGSDKQFEVGSVTVTDSNDSLYRYTNWESTLTTFKDDLINSLGGHLRVRYDGTHRYLDYLADYPRLSGQKIEFGQNLLTYSETSSAYELATVCIPLGARQEESAIAALEERLTISSVNNGKDYLELTAAINSYGRIVKTVTWDNVNTASILMAKGQKWLQSNQYSDLELTLTAVDLADFGVDVDHLRLLDRIHCTSDPHGMDTEFPLTSLQINLVDPSQNVYTLGSKTKAFSSSSSRAQKSIQSQLNNQPSKSNVLKQALDNATALINMTGKDGHIIFSPSIANANELCICDYDNLDDAQRIWRFNLNGFGYSSNGYAGPFETAITMDGTIAGRFIAAGTIGADQINVNYTSAQEKKWQDELENNYWTATEVQTGINNSADAVKLYATQQDTKRLKSYYTKSEIDVTVNGINSTVSKKVGTNEIISKINQSAESVKISSSKFDVDASAIRLKATTIQWDSTYSSLTQTGKLTATSVNLSGTMKCGTDTSYWIKMASGQITGGYGSNTYGTIDYSATYTGSGSNWHGLWMKSYCTVIYTNVLGISRSYSSSSSTRGYTGSCRVTYNMNSDMTSCMSGTLEFINGICVNCP